MALIKYWRRIIETTIHGPGDLQPFNSSQTVASVSPNLSGDSIIRCEADFTYGIELTDTAFHPHLSWPQRITPWLGIGWQSEAHPGPVDLVTDPDKQILATGKASFRGSIRNAADTEFASFGTSAVFDNEDMVQTFGQRKAPDLAGYSVAAVIHPQFIDSGDWFPFGTSSYVWWTQCYLRVLFGAVPE